jgi:hypothetical protein
VLLLRWHFCVRSAIPFDNLPRATSVRSPRPEEAISNPTIVSRRAFLTASGLVWLGRSGRADTPLGDGPCAAASNHAVVAGAGEPGERLFVRGQLFAPDGERKAAGVLVYAYQTDARGLYNSDPQAPPRLRAYMKTDAEGRFDYETIRPASYPGQTVPAHIHHQAWGGGWPQQWLAELNFADDPRIGTGLRSESEKAGRFAWVLAPRRTARGLEVDLNLRLKPTGNALTGSVRHGRSGCGL